MVDLTKTKLLWCDLETTGLDENSHCITEVALVVTDGLLNELDFFTSEVFQPPEELAKMSDFARQSHTDSGLLFALQVAPPLPKVEPYMIDFIRKHFVGPVVLHGNSVSFDRKFIRRHMLQVEPLVHYRGVDVSSFKESLKLYLPGNELSKKQTHRALDDIRESIQEYKHYLTLLKLI